MILRDFSLKPYCTHFGKIWWYLVWSQSYWPWISTHFKDKCNVWSNPHKMDVTLFLLQYMIIGTKLCINIHSNNTDWMTYQLSWSDVTARNYDTLNFRNVYLLKDWEQAYRVHKTKMFIFIIKLTNIDQETSKVEGAKSALPQYYRAPKYWGYIGLKNEKNITCRVKNSTYRVMVHIGLKIAKHSTYRVKKCKRTLFWDHLWPYLPKIWPMRIF